MLKIQTKENKDIQELFDTLMEDMKDLYWNDQSQTVERAKLGFGNNQQFRKSLIEENKE